MLLVSDRQGNQFTVTEHFRTKVQGLSFTTYEYWVKDGRELTEPEKAELTIVREIDSTP